MSTPHRHAFLASLRREIPIASVVGAPTLAYVLLTNDSASLAFILLHGVCLFWLVPTSVALATWAFPAPPGRTARGSVLRPLLVRSLGLALGVAGTVLLVAVVAGLPLSAILVRPLAVALVPLFLGYALVALVLEWATLREHALSAEASEALARQAALSARIRPHFLFNTLNCIEQLADTDPPAARVAVGRLSRLFRAVLDVSGAPSVVLADELRLVDDYLGIEQIRFGRRFRYELQVDAASERRTLPSTMLLTLVENAIKHGVEKTPGPVAVRLCAITTHETTRISITSPTPPGAGRKDASQGYGHRDVRERLQLAYGTRATLSMSERDGATHVELELPV